MNAENFAEYLKNPARLYQVNYQELKSLVLQYPYCQNLQWLLLQKSSMDRHKDFDTNLERTATGSLSRSLLFRQMHDALETQKPTNLVRLDEVLDLRERSYQRPAAIPATPKQEQVPPEPPQAAPIPAPAPPLPPTDEDEVLPPVAPLVIELEVALPPKPTVETPLPLEVNAISTEATLPTQTASREEKTSEIPASKIQPPMPIAPLKPTFSGMAGKYTPPQLQAPTLPNPTEKERKAAQAAALAMQSIIEKEEVISETLADLLARQGHQEKAIQMYERLSLQFPQKSTYFAARIQKLKQP
jgi:hypothetical protein